MNAGFQVTVDGHVAHFGGSDSPNQSYNWSFGDGTFGFGPQPVHTYTNPGTYTACLAVWAWDPQTQDSCSPIIAKRWRIGGGGSPCDNLNADFQVTVDGQEAHFGGSDSPNQHYNWNFGDGTYGYGPQPVHPCGTGHLHCLLTCLAWNAQTQDTCFEDHCETVVIGGGGSPRENLNAGFQVTVDGQVAHSAAALRQTKPTSGILVTTTSITVRGSAYVGGAWRIPSLFGYLGLGPSSSR
ncbi:MAG: PKD domain-containing protein [Flavobacteriales bacterium]|nr:PKD domain-containing protein [Flavobacteriales bacterium]